MRRFEKNRDYFHANKIISLLQKSGIYLLNRLSTCLKKLMFLDI